MQAYPQVVPYIPTKTPAHANQTVSYTCVQCDELMTFQVGEVLPMRCQKCGYRIIRKLKKAPKEGQDLNLKKSRVYLAR